MWTLLLVILMTNQPSRVMVSNHAPFATQAECNAYAASIEDKTTDALKNIDGYHGHATLCVQAADKDAAE